MTYHKRESCRACGYPGLLSVLDLGRQPLANGFRSPEDTGDEPTYPLHLVRCPQCELVQLSVVVDPAVMYGRQYAYRSGYSEGWALHCHALAKEIGKGKHVLEVGCLDGVMLKHCQENGCQVLGVDPSSPQDLPVPIRRELFTRDSRFDRFYDWIVAQNVFGHVDDAEGFLLACRNALHSEGTLVLECPWVVDLIDGVRWDTVYHEHLSYWGLRPLMRLAQRVGLAVERVQPFPEIHGGTMRYYVKHAAFGGGVDPAVYSVWRDEEMDTTDWDRFQRQTMEQVARWDNWFFAHYCHALGAYGASAKLNVFLNTLERRPTLDYVFDDSPVKQGLVTPGWRIPVVAPTPDRLAELDIILVGAPNWIQGIEAKARTMGFTGQVLSLWQ